MSEENRPETTDTELGRTLGLNRRQLFAATTGVVVPVPSSLDRSTSSRESTAEGPGTRNTSA